MMTVRNGSIELCAPAERRSPEYKRGVRALAAWHIKCAAKRRKKRLDAERTRKTLARLLGDDALDAETTV